MATGSKSLKGGNSSDEELPEAVAVIKSESSASGQKRPQEPTLEAEKSSPLKAAKQRKEDNRAAAESLAAIYRATPGKSQSRQAIKDLQAEREAIAKEQRKVTKKVKAEAQRQKRLREKASQLSNADLLELFRQRHEVKEAREQAPAKAKAKAKAAATVPEN